MTFKKTFIQRDPNFSRGVYVNANFNPDEYEIYICSNKHQEFNDTLISVNSEVCGFQYEQIQVLPKINHFRLFRNSDFLVIIQKG